MRSKQAFLDQTQADWAAWQAAIAAVPEERLHEPGASGHWSVKDLIAHITVFERWTIEWLEPALEGNPPAWSYPDGKEIRDIDEENAHYYEQNRERTLEDIQAEAARVHEQMMALLDRIPEDSHSTDIRDYSSPVGDHYQAGTTILGAIDGNAAEHYHHHTADVRRWLKASL